MTSGCGQRCAAEEQADESARRFRAEGVHVYGRDPPREDDAKVGSQVGLWPFARQVHVKKADEAAAGPRAEIFCGCKRAPMKRGI